MIPSPSAHGPGSKADGTAERLAGESCSLQGGQEVEMGRAESSPLYQAPALTAHRAVIQGLLRL